MKQWYQYIGKVPARTSHRLLLPGARLMLSEGEAVRLNKVYVDQFVETEPVLDLGVEEVGEVAPVPVDVVTVEDSAIVEEEEFPMNDLIELHGVGPAKASRLEMLGIKNIATLAGLDDDALMALEASDPYLALDDLLDWRKQAQEYDVGD